MSTKNYLITTFFVVFAALYSAGEVVNEGPTEQLFWDRKTVEGTISFEGTPANVQISYGEQGLKISASSGGILLHGSDLIVSDYKRDGNWMVFFIDKLVDGFSARNDHSLLVCHNTEWGVMATEFFGPGDRSHFGHDLVLPAALVAFDFPRLTVNLTIEQRNQHKASISHVRAHLIFGKPPSDDSEEGADSTKKPPIERVPRKE